MRRFELSEGKSHKFWEIDIQGTSFTVRYGRIGANGKSGTKTFPTAEKAQAEAKKAIGGKTRKGYAEILADITPSPIAPPNPQLEALLIDDFESAEIWTVYADWLMEQGDARGEIIRHTLDGDPERAKSIQRVNEEQWLGAFWPIFMALRKETRGWDSDNRLAELSWDRGFLTMARVGSVFDGDTDLPEILTALFASPAARLLRRLKLGLPAHDGQVDYSKTLEYLGALAPKPSIIDVHLGDFSYPDETEISWTDIGLIDPLFTAFPNLTALHVQGGSIQVKRLPATLRTLKFETGGLPAGTFGAVCASPMPLLTRMEIWLGSTDYGAATAPDEIDALLDGKNTPKLTWLGLKNGETAHQLIARMIGSPVLARLETLDLSMGTLNDERAQILIDQADAFAHLKKIVVSDNFLTGGFLQRLKSALPRQVVSSQQKDVEDDWIYTSVGE